MQRSRDFQSQLIPEQILPSQWLARRSLSPAQRLWLATLEDAIYCLNGLAYNGHKRAKKQATEEAHAWVMDQSEGVATFAFVCHILKLDPTWLREKILAQSVTGPRL
jgi:hypothetical protein